jgi:OOP family OmpA-OmpF porin
VTYLGSQSFSGDGAYSGVGVGYDITPHFSLGVNFDEYHGRATVYGTKAREAVSSLSGFAEYRF